MKFLPAVILSLVCLTRAWALAPENIGGFLLQTTTTTMAHGRFTSATVLAADGTFTQLYRGGVTTSSVPYLLSDPDQGTYRYRRIDDATAELTWIRAGGREMTETLQFSSATTAGSWVAESWAPAVWTFHRFTPLDAPALWTNASNRSLVRAGGVAFSGFVLTEQRTVLVRAVGPGLKRFGVTECLKNPHLKLLGSRNPEKTENDNWRAESELSIARTSAYVGAAPLATDTKDAAVIKQLYPGAYVAQVSSSDPTDSGEAMIEIYLLP